MYTHGGIAHSTAALAERASATCASRTSTMMSEEFAPGGARTYRRASYATSSREDGRRRRSEFLMLLESMYTRIYIYIYIYTYTRVYARIRGLHGKSCRRWKVLANVRLHLTPRIHTG